MRQWKNLRQERSDSTRENGTVKFPLIDLEIENAVSGNELWSGEAFSFDGEFSATVPSHGVKVYYFN